MYNYIYFSFGLTVGPDGVYCHREKKTPTEFRPHVDFAQHGSTDSHLSLSVWTYLSASIRPAPDLRIHSSPVGALLSNGYDRLFVDFIAYFQNFSYNVSCSDSSSGPLACILHSAAPNWPHLPLATSRSLQNGRCGNAPETHRHCITILLL